MGEFPNMQILDDWGLTAWVACATVAFAVALLLGTAATSWVGARLIRWGLSPAGDSIELGAQRVHVLDEGSGCAVLMLHGLSGNLRHFSLGVCARLAQGMRIIAVDRPGSPHSLPRWRWRAPESLGLRAQADLMVQLLDHLGVERAVVVGHSLGGALALAMAQRHPQRVAALALIAPLVRLPSEVPLAFRGLVQVPLRYRALIAHTVALPIALLRSKRALALVFAPESIPRAFATQGGGLLAVHPSSLLAASHEIEAVARELPLLFAHDGAFQVPVHCLFGRQDAILDCEAQCEALRAHIPNVALRLVNGGHMLPVTQAAPTAAFIEGVVASLAGHGSAH